MTSQTGETGQTPGAEPFEPPGVVWSNVSPRLATVRRVLGAVPLLVLALAAVVAAVLLSWPWLSVIAALCLLVAGWLTWIVGRQVGAMGYAERDEELLVRRGILWRRIVVVPYGRLQYVDVQAGPVERIFGIARVQLHTASAGTDAAIAGLPPKEAARLRDRLADRGQARLAGL
ncbi:MAG TPA: PH domain-containing protein [Kineosporiaceae bacterium]|jgi:membrane protein YdbS with pleckstrin-like domain|nr:PH domain-containing protein [Kineosporiaceae bacterium]